MLPNFFIIGAPKCGTTSVYEYLRQHSQVFMSPVKETDFFSVGLSGAKPTLSGPRVVRDLGAYCDLFSGVTTQIAIGEASGSYMRFPETAGRIRQYIPTAKLIAVLRDPIDRAYSDFLMFRRMGVEPLTDFGEAFEAARSEYLERGRYLPQLQRYLEHFPQEQLRVYLYEDLQADAARMVKEVFRFLRVDECFQVDTDRRYNEAFVLRSLRVQAWLDRVDHTPEPIRSTSRLLIPGGLVGRAYRRLDAWNRRPAPPAPPGIRRRYVPMLRDEILDLQGLIGRDLSAWLTTDP